MGTTVLRAATLVAAAWLVGCSLGVEGTLLEADGDGSSAEAGPPESQVRPAAVPDASRGVDPADASAPDAGEQPDGSPGTSPETGTVPRQDGSSDAHASGDSGNACGVSCNTTTGSPTCSASTCSYACIAGLADCNAAVAPNTDGCESSLSSISSCGACGNACDVTHSTGAGCNGTTCTYAGCAAGRANCNMAAPDTDGCETSLASTSNCAGCGNVCDTSHSVSAACDGTTCQYASCAAGYGDCQTAAPDTDGCETLLSSTSNCGGCANACDTSTGTPSCGGTSCTYVCRTGLADCNARVAPDLDGCETRLDSASNCGRCGNACNGSCTTHSDGLGQTFNDCRPPFTYDQAQAVEACTAANHGSCTNVTSACGDSGVDSAVCTCPSSFGFGAQYCWVYAGPHAGDAFTSTTILGCSACPAGLTLPWN